MQNDYPGVVSSINVIPLTSELRECLQRMEVVGMDEDLIDHVREQLNWREEE